MDEHETQTAEPGGGARERIGPYRILEKIGEGGMGEVWLAEQTEPVRRRVAVKVMRRGLDTDRIVARFEAERQALALMDHPAIAKVFDAGATPDGRPYFAMEHVRGEALTSYCDGRRLGTRERLALFVRVSEGVQHAHQKAVIHRDLKPSNILVAEIGGKPYPKIIDFGIAKALSQPLTERTLHTEFGALIGTLEYMSPEQAEGRGHDVDTRSDVYSLGILLYELLVGALPFDSETLRRAGIDAVRRRLREEDPLRPSRRLSTLDWAVSAESARRRSVDLRTLRRQLSGDLDEITMKALEKDRSRRYGSPQELVADVERYLADRPIVARPPSLTYRIGKFVRRHRVGVGATAAALVVAMAFAGLVAWQGSRLAEERERTLQEVRSAADLIGRLDRDAASGGVIGFEIDLDQFTPLGSGTDNAAIWFRDFVQPDGPRLDEWEAARQRAFDARDSAGERQEARRTRTQALLLPDDPLLLEAERQVDQAVMRFYPDAFRPGGIRTQVPNLLMMLGLARSWIDRGDRNPDPTFAMEDYRRAIRLGRLLRQEDLILLNDSVGLMCIREGLEAMGRRLREIGDERGADKSALALHEITSQRLASFHRRTSLEIEPYLRRSWFGTSVDLPNWKLDSIAQIAVADLNRRFRVEAVTALCVIRDYGRKEHRARAAEILAQLAGGDDALLAGFARCPGVSLE